MVKNEFREFGYYIDKQCLVYNLEEYEGRFYRRILYPFKKNACFEVYIFRRKGFCVRYVIVFKKDGCRKVIYDEQAVLNGLSFLMMGKTIMIVGYECQIYRFDSDAKYFNFDSPLWKKFEARKYGLDYAEEVEYCAGIMRVRKRFSSEWIYFRIDAEISLMSRTEAAAVWKEGSLPEGFEAVPKEDLPLIE